MLVKEVDGQFLTWFGTNELPASVEFTMSDEELAANGLIRPLPEDTTPPTPYHVPSAVTVERINGIVRRVCAFDLTPDVDAARETAAAIVAVAHAQALAEALKTWPYAGPDEDIEAAFATALAAHLAFIATASVYELSMRIWTWPPLESLYE